MPIARENLTGDPPPPIAISGIQSQHDPHKPLSLHSTSNASVWLRVTDRKLAFLYGIWFNRAEVAVLPALRIRGLIFNVVLDALSVYEFEGAQRPSVMTFQQNGVRVCVFVNCVSRFSH